MSVLSRALAISSLAVIASAPVAVAADPPPSQLPSSSPTVAVTPDWQSLEPTAVIDLPNARGAIGLATDGATVWAVGAGQLARIDGATNAVEYLTAPVAPDDTGLLLADDGMWVTRWSGGKVYRLDPTTGEVELEVDLPSAVNPQLVGDQLWVGREDHGDMIMVDRVTGALGDPMPGGPFSAYGMGSPDSLWFAHKGVAPTVTRIDPATGETIATIELPAGTGCSVGGPFPNAVYTSGCLARDAADRPFARIDPATNRVVATTVLPATHGAAPFLADGLIWLLGYFEADGTTFAGMVGVDPASGAVEQWISLGAIDPDGAVVANGAIWVADEGGHQVLRYDLANLTGS
jgi:streptogramin lyase